MDRETLRHHLALAADRTGGAALLRAARPEPDRSVPGALGWLRHWHPGRAGITPRACSCPRRGCPVCN